MSKLRGVLIGAGYFSDFHLDAWTRIPEVDLAAVCDLDLAKAQAACEKYGVEASFDNVSDMLDAIQPDFVDIVTRPDSHLELTRKIASRGIAIICQKPLAPLFSEAKELVDITDAANARLMVHENFRFQPWHREIKSLLQGGVIGEQLFSLAMRTRTGDGWQEDAYLARQPYFRTMPRFLIFETGVHFIDTFRYLAGEIDSVFASLRKLNRNIQGEDAGTILFNFAGGAQGIWDANRYNESTCENARLTFGELLVEGDQGSIRLHEDGRIFIKRLGEPEHEHTYNWSDLNFAGDCVLATQQHFVHCMLNDLAFETSGPEYLKTLEVQEAIYKSADLGCPIHGLVAKEPSNASD